MSECQGCPCIDQGGSVCCFCGDDYAEPDEDWPSGKQH